MKKLTIILICALLFSLSGLTASAQEVDLSGIYKSLSDEARQSLSDIGASSADPNTLQGITPDKLFGRIGDLAGEQAQKPLRALVHITAALLICAMLGAYKNSLSPETGGIPGAASALCICCAVVTPALQLIEQAQGVITSAANLMLAYVPVMAALLAAGGSVSGAGAYCASVLAAGEGVNRLCGGVLVPFLNMFLGISVVAGVTPDLSLGGLCAVISKAFKWLLGFSMAVFTSVTGMRRLLSDSLDTVGGRAVKFAVSSFVPVVGSALADAYNTVQGSVGLLKSGVGVFVILAVAFTFLPVLLRVMLWSAVLWAGKTTAEILGVPQAARLLDSLAAVFSSLTALLLCVGAVFIISTAVVLTVRNGAA